MYHLNFLIILVFFLNACSQNFQNNGLSKKKLDNFEINIGKTSKQFLTKKYGPPIFENIFNKNVIYYVSHNTSYKTFENVGQVNYWFMRLYLIIKILLKTLKNILKRQLQYQYF